MLKSTETLLLLIAFIFFGSCSTFKEVHYFSDSTEDLPNYYRVKVSGFSFFSSSRYISGYFDPKAVNEYFNETKQPAKANLNLKPIKATSNGSGDTADASQGINSMQRTGANERLVLIYSTNSDAVSNQIGLISENEATMDALSFLLFENRSQDLRDIEIQNKISKQSNEVLASLGDVLIDSLDVNSAPKGQVNASLLQYLNILAAEMGNLTPFANFAEARYWLERNRSGILNSTK